LDVSKRGIRDESTKKMRIYTKEENSTKDMPFERKISKYLEYYV
jgi:PII-like signaling protein